MVELQRQRVEHEMTKMVDELDKQFLRKMQADMHRCAAKCCDDPHSSIETVQRCVQACSNPLQNAQNYVQKELEHLQSRLQRCVLECNDTIKDKMGPSPSETDINKFNLMFENCAVQCVDKQVELIPKKMKEMKSKFAKGIGEEA